jgi:hypothetical protein
LKSFAIDAAFSHWSLPGCRLLVAIFNAHGVGPFHRDACDCHATFSHLAETVNPFPFADSRVCPRSVLVR